MSKRKIHKWAYSKKEYAPLSLRQKLLIAIIATAFIGSGIYQYLYSAG